MMSNNFADCNFNFGTTVSLDTISASFDWTMYNYKVIKSVGERICSKFYPITRNNDLRVRLAVYPKGRYYKNKNSMSVYLGIVMDTYEQVRVRLNVAILDEGREIIYERQLSERVSKKRYKSPGFKSFITNRDLMSRWNNYLRNGHLVIRWKLEIDLLSRVRVIDIDMNRYDSDSDVSMIDLTKIKQEREAKDFSDQVKQEIFNFISDNIVYKMSEVAEELIYAAKDYCIHELVDLCEKYLCQTICCKNALRLLVIADDCKALKLREKIIAFIANNLEVFVNDREYRKLTSKCRALSSDILKYMSVSITLSQYNELKFLKYI